MHSSCVLHTLVVFRVYDTDNDGYISKDDLIHVSLVLWLATVMRLQ